MAVPKDSYYRISATEDGITVSWTGYNGEDYTSSVIGWPANLHSTHTFQLSDYVDKTANPELNGLDFTYTYTVADYASLDNVIASINGCSVSSSLYCYESIKPSFDGTVSNPEISFITEIKYSALLAADKKFDVYDTDFIQPNDTDKYGVEHATTFYPNPRNGTLASVMDALDNSKGLNLVDDAKIGGYIKMNFNLNADNGSYSVGKTTYNSTIGTVTMKIHVTETDTVETVMAKLRSLNGLDIYAGTEDGKNPSRSTYGTMGDVKKVEFDSPIYQATNRLNIQSGANRNQNIEVTYTAYDIFQLGLEDTRCRSGRGDGQVLHQQHFDAGSSSNAFSGKSAGKWNYAVIAIRVYESIKQT